MTSSTLAQRLIAGDRATITAAAEAVLPVRPDNFVPRPWGGRRLFAWKGLPEPAPDDGPFGEVFEVSGDRRDPESSEHPSTVLLADGSEIPLPLLLDAAGGEILGRAVFAAHGPNLPLLPKVLDVRQLLSLQTHPPGNPEAYYVLEAEPGATLRIGFVRDLERDTLRELFVAGREAQESLLEILESPVDERQLQQALAGALREAGGPDALLDAVRPFLSASANEAEAKTLLSCLAGAWRQTLELLTEVPARPAEMLLNATPPEEHGPVSAEVHALGNPDGRRVLLFEIRRPAPTHRAWDHVRYPLRDIEIDRSLAAMRLRERTAPSFVVPPEPVEGRPGAYRSVSCDAFAVEHLRPTAEDPVDVGPHAHVRTFHVVKGAVEVRGGRGGGAHRFPRGTSAVLPAGVGPLTVRALAAPAEALVVSLPDPGTA